MEASVTTIRRATLTVAALGILASVFGMVGCGTADVTTAGTSATGDVLRVESYCDVPDLPKSLRHTFILLDQAELTHSGSAEEFVRVNGTIRDALLAFGDPARATQAGFLDWRERISLFLIPPGGAEAKLLFTGCAPSLSPAEMAAAQAGDPAWKRFFVGGFEQKLDEDRDRFRSYFLGAILRAAADAPHKANVQSGPLSDSDVMRSLRASGRFINCDNGVPRLVLMANLAGIDTGSASDLMEARRAGFTDGAKSGMDLGRSELHVFLVNGPKSDLAREYVSAFALAQNARLISWARSPSMLPLAPSNVERYSGTVDYVTLNAPIQVRLAVDRNGALVDSWLILQENPDQAIPLTGTYACDAPEQCHAISDKGGFAQAWSSRTGVEPEFDRNLPFAGARSWKFTVEKKRLTGMIFDPVMSFPPPHPQLALTAGVATGATF